MKFRRNPSAALDAWRKLCNTQTTSPSSLQVRASSMPICPRAYWLDRRLGPMSSDSSYVRDVSAARGTVVHEQLQKWLGRAGILFGYWACPLRSVHVRERGSAGVKFPACTHLIGPRVIVSKPWPRCPHHDLELVYEEVSIRWRGTTGHVDSLLTWTGKPPFVLVDFKTANTYGYADFVGFQRLVEPYHKHVHQANFYAVALSHGGGVSPKNPDRQIKLPISEVQIMYFHNDYLQRKPKAWGWTPDASLVKDHLADLRMLERADKADRLPKRAADCSDKPRAFCALAGPCFAPNLKAMLE